MWAPDVYEGSSASMAGYMSIVPKIAAFIVAMRFFEFLVHSGIVWVEYILYAFVVITMTAANLWALVQTDVKRMLAYSSISHAGFVMAALALSTTEGTAGIFLYYALFMFTTLGHSQCYGFQDIKTEDLMLSMITLMKSLLVSLKSCQ